MSASVRQFRIGVCLGRGGFGEVYRATMVSAGGIQTTVAIKVLRADLRTEADAMRRLRDEGRLLARLHHPAILKVYDMVLLEERVTLVAEFVDGADLEEWNTRIPVRPLLQVLGAVCGALHAAYSAKDGKGRPLKLVHRDIKPTNIRLGRHGEVKVLDFGIAHFQADDREAYTATGLVVGSLPYMAPERFSSADVIPASDIFSLGCTMYESLTAEHFLGDGSMRVVSQLALQQDVFQAHANKRLDALDLDPRVRELLRDVLAFEPEERPTADALSARLEELADQLDGPSLRTWCRAQTWPESSAAEGPLAGRVISEGTIPISDGLILDPASGPVVHTAPQETLDVIHGLQTAGVGPSLFEHPYTEEDVRREVVTTDPPAGTGRYLAVGCGVVLLLSLLGLAVASAVGFGAFLWFV